MNYTNRVLVQDLIKNAAYLGVQRQKAASEAAKQIAEEMEEEKKEEEKEEDDEDKEKKSNKNCAKLAADGISSSYANSLADALEYIGMHPKIAESNASDLPNSGITATNFSGAPVASLGGKQVIPMHVPLQSAGEHDPNTQMENDDDQPPGGGSTQKVAYLYRKNIRKIAEMLNVSASGEAGGSPAGGMPVGPTGLVASNESARNYTRRQAYANRKEELKNYFSEPALSQATDPVLSSAFAHTAEAGAKVASAGLGWNMLKHGNLGKDVQIALKDLPDSFKPSGRAVYDAAGQGLGLVSSLSGKDITSLILRRPRLAGTLAGAAVGGGVGAVAGGKDNRGKGALKGALIGGAVGNIGGQAARDTLIDYAYNAAKGKPEGIINPLRNIGRSVVHTPAAALDTVLGRTPAGSYLRRVVSKGGEKFVDAFNEAAGAAAKTAQYAGVQPYQENQEGIKKSAAAQALYMKLNGQI